MDASLSPSENRLTDHSRLAGTYLIVLGVLSVVSLYPTGININLGGIFFIWFGFKVRERHEAFRKASLWLIGLYLASVIVLLLWATIFGTDHLTLDFFSYERVSPPLWLVYIFVITAVIILGVPFYWLRQDKYPSKSAAN
jgi:hypothetical protein